MTKILVQSLFLFSCLLVFAFSVDAQVKKQPAVERNDSTTLAVLDGVGKVGVVVVGSAAKVAWGTTKFVLKDMAVPVAKGLAKPMATRMAPAMTKFALKNSAKYLLPIAVKLSIL